MAIMSWQRRENYHRKTGHKKQGYTLRLYFNEWFESANGFLRQYKHAVNDGDLKIAVFLLHQAAERYFMTILLVFTDYKPRTHDLEDLNRQAGYVDVRFKTIFPNQTEEEKRLFTILVKAYIDSRYKLGYTIAAEDLQWLAARVVKLKELTEMACVGRIEGFGVIGS